MGSMRLKKLDYWFITSTAFNYNMYIWLQVTQTIEFTHSTEYVIYEGGGNTVFLSSVSKRTASPLSYGRLECGRTQLEVPEELGIAQSVISSLCNLSKMMHPYGLASILTGLESSRACGGQTCSRDTVDARQPPLTREPELCRALSYGWCKIPQDQIDSLILSMSRRCTDCIASFGRHTMY
ncbi:hypothetical protein TNCV_4818701 [Trichonephila clavipes]|nr:hypothetical protein TNCV_4818701 [Trichonephila clavipes]